jgi:hypothetical protein
MEAIWRGLSSSAIDHENNVRKDYTLQGWQAGRNKSLKVYHFTAPRAFLIFRSAFTEAIPRPLFFTLWLCWTERMVTTTLIR